MSPLKSIVSKVNIEMGQLPILQKGEKGKRWNHVDINKLTFETCLLIFVYVCLCPNMLKNKIVNVDSCFNHCLGHQQKPTLQEEKCVWIWHIRPAHRSRTSWSLSFCPKTFCGYTGFYTLDVFIYKCKEIVFILRERKNLKTKWHH